MYEYWSGTINFRFRIVSTQYHRGRIKIQFDPANIDPTIAVFNDTTNITRIYDISTDTDVEVCVPWMQTSAYARNRVFDSNAPSNTPCYESGIGSGISNQPLGNGYLRVSVANELNAPTNTAPVTIVVFVSGGDDFEVMAPRTITDTIQWALQGSTQPLDAEICDMMGQTSDDIDQINLVYGGESAVSLRQLLHRHCYSRAFSHNDVTTCYVSTDCIYPLPREVINDSPANIHLSNAFTGNLRLNYVANTFENMLAPCFAGKRGSMYWMLNVMGKGSNDWRTKFSRIPNSNGVGPASYDTEKIFNKSTPSTICYTTDIGGIEDTGAGAALYHSKTQTGATILIPYIDNSKFVGTYPSPFNDSGNIRFYGDSTFFKTVISTGVVSAEEFYGSFYCATGPDYNLFFFTGVPTMESIAAVPSALP